MTAKFSNFFTTNLASPISAGATSFTVNDATNFPDISAAEDYSFITLASKTNSNIEVVKCTSISGTTITCEATSYAYAADDYVQIRMCAEIIDDLDQTKLDISTYDLAEQAIQMAIALG